MTAVQDTAPTIDVQKGSLHHFHLRLGLISYDTVERMAKDPDYGINSLITCVKTVLRALKRREQEQDSPRNTRVKMHQRTLSGE